MTTREFTNHYHIIIYALFLLIHGFKKEDNIFAAQCIWWLASIIQYTEVLTYYFDYQIFPSECLRDFTVTLLPQKDDSGTIVPDADTPEIGLILNSDIKNQLSGEELRIDTQISKHNQSNSTWSGWLFTNKPKYREPSILELEQHFGKQGKKQRRRTRDHLQAEYKVM